MKTSDFQELLTILMNLDENNNVNQDVVQFVQGFPGIGKSAIIRQIADKLGYFHFLDIRLSQHDATDLKGIPNTVEEEGSKLLKWIPPDFMPLRGSRFDDGKPGVLFFDELNRAPVEVLQAVFEIVHDRRIGMKPILDNWFIIAAGNYGYEDGTDVVEMDSALKNRFQMIYLESPTFAEWKVWAEEVGIHPIIIDFLEQYPDNLHYRHYVERQNHGTEELVTPRTWEKFSHILNRNKGNEVKITKLMGETFIGTIQPVFAQFVQSYSSIRPKDVVSNYEKVKDEILQMDRHEILELMDKIEQYIRNTPISDVSDFTKFFKNHLTEDNQVSLIVRLSNSDAGLVFIEKFMRANSDINQNSPQLAKRIEEELRNR